MRVLVVSAHYPPNFTSGGTLVPQRLARGLRARGHDVHVYAGWLGAERPPLEAWDEVDETGLRLRWIVTEPWTAWADRHNFDNPEVVADFARHLAVVRPDVVHAHSLQTLGAGVLEAASRAGAKVVLTMHDMWWFCARQFLVDRSYQPCPLVVDAGECPCEAGHRWLGERNAWLRRRLDMVDLVLTPSASAAAVLAANGVDPARLEVDENGLPGQEEKAPAPARGAARAGGPVRLLYAGGPDRMKGVHVLLAAADRLSDRRGWRLRAHGIERFLAEAPGAIDGLPVDAVPPFDPPLADQAFAEADVLVVPSVMRETHSLITREALSRGIPVVCTDCIGPEEVVTDGHNGLIVPTADHRALAGAIERLLDERPLLDHLRSNCTGVTVRPLDDQVAGLEDRFARLLDPAPSPSSPSSAARPGRTVRRVGFLVGIDGAPLRYRVWLPVEGLRLLGVETEVYQYRDERAVTAFEAVDAVVAYRVPATPDVLDLIGRLRARGVPVFFDVDDLIFDPGLADEIPALRQLPGDEAELWLEGVHRYRTTMEACDAFIGSTPSLVRHAAGVTGLPSFLFENGVGTAVARASTRALARPRAPGPARMGYLSGTTTHDEDWAMVEPVVASLLERFPDLELRLVGHVVSGPDLERFGERVQRVPFVPWTELPDVLRDLHVNLAPLAPGSRFNEAKSAIKWLEAALVGTPTVASPTQPFRDAVDDGVTGYLAATPEEWEDAIVRLVVDHRLGSALGRRARRAALLRWSPHLQARRYRSILGGDLPPRAGGTAWTPVTLDEPFGPVAVGVDPTGGHVLAPPGPGTLLRRAGSIARRGARRYRADGPVAAARSAVRFAARQARARGPR